MIARIVDFVKHNARFVVLVVIVIILVVVNFMFYSDWQSATDQRAKLQKEETSARVNLNIAKDQYDLDKLRAQQAALVGSGKFPSSYPSVDLSAYLAAAAEKYGVTLTSVTPKGAAGNENIGGKQYPRYEVDMKASGGTENVNLFMRYLEEGPFLTLKLDKLSAVQDASIAGQTDVSLTVAVLVSP